MPNAKNRSRGIRVALAWLAKAALAGVALLLVLLLGMWGEHALNITLPSPTGRFGVGRTMFAWTDSAARDVLVWMWYPAARSSDRKPGEYLPAPWRAALGQQEGRFMREFFTHDPAVVHTHAFADAEVAEEQRQYPVVILRAGGGALTTDFTALAEDLASHGFFVVGFDAPYRTYVVVLPDGRVVARSPELNVENANGNLDDPVVGKVLALWTSDTKFVVDQFQVLNAGSSRRFAGRMNLERLGMVGHSLGGATALQFCHEDARCKAAIDLDGIPFGSVVRDGLDKPGMFLLSDHRREMSDPSSQRVVAEIQSIYSRLPEGRLCATIRGASHFAFSDQILLNSQIAIGLLRLGGVGALDGRRGLAISADYVHTFFDVYLNEAPRSSLANLSQAYQEVQIEGN